MLYCASMYSNSLAAEACQPNRARALTASGQQLANDLMAFCVPSQQHKLNLEFSLEDHIKKTRKAAAYLKQVLHSRACQGACGSQTCARTVLVLRHVASCSSSVCGFGGCMTTMKLLEHTDDCGARIRGGTHFCLLCTIATSDVQDANRLRTPSYDLNNFIDTFEEGEFAPVINDEIIEFSRVPFQRSNPCSPTHGRCKTYSESHVMLGFEPSSKKMRSKSLNIAGAQ